jgi:hypothetical protein
LLRALAQLLDLGVFKRGKQVMSIKQSLIWCGVWAGLAMLFNVGVFLFHPRGTDAGLEFFTGYVTEQLLSVDNIFKKRTASWNGSIHGSAQFACVPVPSMSGRSVKIAK